MNSSKTIVKQTVNKDLELCSSAEATARTSRCKDGQETQIEITHERIRIRAYEIFLARNGGPGDPTADWCQAERELNSKADVGPVCVDSTADSAVPDIKTRSESRRQPASSVRGGL